MKAKQEDVVKEREKELARKQKEKEKQKRKEIEAKNAEKKQQREKVRNEIGTWKRFQDNKETC